MTTHIAANVTSTWTTFSTRTAWCAALENKLHPFHVRTVELVQGKSQTSLSTVFSVGAKQGCVHLPISVSWRDVKKNYYATEVRVCDNLINRFQVTVSEDVPGQLFFVRGSFWRNCEACIHAEVRQTGLGQRFPNYGAHSLVVAWLVLGTGEFLVRDMFILN
jgi:hypothetical protein